MEGSNRMIIKWNKRDMEGRHILYIHIEERISGQVHRYSREWMLFMLRMYKNKDFLLSLIRPCICYIHQSTGYN